MEKYFSFFLFFVFFMAVEGCVNQQPQKKQKQVLGNRWTDKESSPKQKTQKNTRPEALPYPSFTAPGFTLEQMDGKKVSLSDYKNQKVILVFWATWCTYCLKELPDLQVIYGNYKNKVNFLLIDIGEQKDLVEKYIKEHNIQLPVLLDTNEEVAKLYQVSGTPSHFFINAEGKIFSNSPGYISHKMLLKFLDNLVAG